MKYRTRLAALRKAKSVSRLALASYGIPYSTIVSWEQDTLDSIDPQQLQLLLHAMRCSYEELVFAVGDAGAGDSTST